MSRGDAQRDVELARSVRPGRRFPDHDHGEGYDGEAAVWPVEALEREPGRYDADGWGCEAWAFEPHDTGTPSKFRWWARCRGCRRLFEGSSREALAWKYREHLS